MSKHLIGLVLIDAPHSALNNAGTQAGQATENIVVVKTLRKGNQIYPYVSGQAWRNWWRTTLGEEFGRTTLGEEFRWKLSPIERETKIAFTAASPVEYDDDDVFGYMRAQKKDTLTRLSPLKCSPLIAAAPQRPTDDFGVMARHKGDPVPYEHQFYSCVLKGIFSLDLDAVGTFWDVNKTGYKNINESHIPKIEEAGGTRSDEKSPWRLPKEIRVRRAKQALQALPLLSGGAKLTSHLTDVTPKLIILTVLDGGNHPFMNLMVEENGEGKLSISALRQVIDDYADRLTDRVYIGRREGFMDELEEPLRQLVSELPDRIVYSSPNRVVAQLAERIPEHIGG